MKYSILMSLSIAFAILLNGCGLSTTTTNLGGTLAKSVSVTGTAKKGKFSSLTIRLKDAMNPTSVLGTGTSTNGDSGNFNVTFATGVTVPNFVLVEVFGNYASEAGINASVADSQPLSTIIEVGTSNVTNIAITPFTSLLVSHMGSNISTQALSDAKSFVANTFDLQISTITDATKLLDTTVNSNEKRKYNMLLAGISQLADDKKATDNKNGIDTVLRQFGAQAKDGFLTDELMGTLSSSLTKISTNQLYRNSSEGQLFYQSGISSTLVDKIKMGSSWSKTKISSSNPDRAGHVGFTNINNSSFYFWGGKSADANSTVTNTVLRYNSNFDLQTANTCGMARAYHSIAMAPNNTMAYAFGGVDASGNVTNALDIFSLSSLNCVGNTTYGGLARSHHSSFYYNDKIYFVGGMGTSTAVTDVNIYSISSGTWSTDSITGPEVAARFGHSTVWDKTMKRALTWGGTAAQSHQNTVHSLAFTGNSIVSSTIATGGLARTSHSGDFYDNGINPRMILFGGAAGQSDTLTNSMQIHDFSKNTFNTIPSKATPKKNMANIQYYDFSKQTHKIVYFGGEKASSVITNEIDIFTIPRSSKR
ncbi:MAG: hypothetical protein KC646_08580 [Candidatus Cloacimonetes bacterium]|nr:hypothetical protein [Candidatus Cloacimonadota bacterium]